MEKIAAPSPDNVFSHGWKIMKANFLELLFIVIILGFIQAPLSWIQENDVDYQYNWNSIETILYGLITNLYALLYWLVIAIPFSFGSAYLFLKAARGEKFEIRAIVAPYSKIVNVVLAEILVIFIVLIGIVLLIIPGIICMIRLSFVPYLIMDKGLDAVGAVKASWKMTAKYGWRIFGMALISIFIFFGGVLFFIVGALVSIMWINTAFASLYFAIDVRENPTVS